MDRRWKLLATAMLFGVLLACGGGPQPTPINPLAITLPYQSGVTGLVDGSVRWYRFQLASAADVEVGLQEVGTGATLHFALFTPGVGHARTHVATIDTATARFDGLAAGFHLLAVSSDVDKDFEGEHDDATDFVFWVRLAADTPAPNLPEPEPSIGPDGTISGRVLTPATLTAVSAESLGIPAAARFASGEVIVRFRDGVSAASTDQVSALGLVTVRSLSVGAQLMRADRVRLPGQTIQADAAEAADTLALLARLRARPDVLYAQPNYLRTASFVPNDPLYADQWHYPMIGLEEAWEVTRGSPDVVVAVLDTGVVIDHEDFADCGRSIMGYDFYDYDADSTDEGTEDDTGFHGTHVAGTVGACSDNGIGVAGVDHEATLLHVRVLGPGGGFDADIANAIVWAAGLEQMGVPLNPNPADVINMSLGGPGPSPVMQEAIDLANGAGAIIVVAAGNESSDAWGYSPASAFGVITVGAVGPTPELASYSNHGTAVEIMAPGGDYDGNLDSLVLSTISDDLGATDDYWYMQGTSMASPHVAGVVALMKALDPDLDWVRASAYLMRTAQPIDTTLCQTWGCGAGLIDVPAALAAVEAAENVSFLVFDGAYDFGFNSQATTLQLHNLGAAAVLVEIGSSDPAISVSPPVAFIAAGGSLDLVVELDRSGLSDDGGFRATLVAQYDGQATSTVVDYRHGTGSEDVGILSDVDVYYYDGVDWTWLGYTLVATPEDGYAFNFVGIPPTAILADVVAADFYPYEQACIFGFTTVDMVALPGAVNVLIPTVNQCRDDVKAPAAFDFSRTRR